MTAAIWKYPVTVDDEFGLVMPEGARVMTVQTQDGQPFLWALVQPDAPRRARKFRVIGTGHPIDDSDLLVYYGTFQLYGGGLVFHLFEVKA